jgi:hypothetical protein
MRGSLERVAESLCHFRWRLGAGQLFGQSKSKKWQGIGTQSSYG